MTPKIDRVLRAVLILALVLSVVPAAQAQMSSAKGRTGLTRPQLAAAKPAGGTQEGIKVHGHWTIVVRDADGKVETRREFENALDGVGKNFLALLLSRSLAMGTWNIELGNLIQQPFSWNPFAALFEPTCDPSICGTNPKTLAVTLVGNVSTGLGVQLKGDTRSAVGGDINAVLTGITTQYQGALTGYAFTLGNVQPPITVAAGRLIEVTVILSFS